MIAQFIKHLSVTRRSEGIHTFDAADQPLVVRGIALSSINEPGLLIYNYRLFKEDVC